MLQIHGEAEFQLGCLNELAEEFLGRFDDGPACLAEAMAMGEREAMVVGWSPPHPRAADDPQPFQIIEVPVDRGHVRFRVDGMHLAREPLGRVMPRRREDRLQEEPARPGDAAAVLPDQSQCILDTLDTVVPRVMPG